VPKPSVGKRLRVRTCNHCIENFGQDFSKGCTRIFAIGLCGSDLQEAVTKYFQNKKNHSALPVPFPAGVKTCARDAQQLAERRRCQLRQRHISKLIRDFLKRMIFEKIEIGAWVRSP
jgi:hypothetical protein